MFKTITPLVCAALVGMFTATAPLSHEFWLEPTEFQVESGAALYADLRNGEDFKGITLPYFDSRSDRLEIWHRGKDEAITARNGDLPAVALAQPKDGLAALVYQSGFSTVTYNDIDKFYRFIKHKDLEAQVDFEAIDAVTDSERTEVYKRFCKSLVAIGSGTGTDVPVGMETEFVALKNPYVDTGPLPVRLLYRGAPRSESQIEVFERAPDGQVRVFLLRTDHAGEAHVPVKAGYDYLLDAVVLRTPAPALAAEYDAIWETLWASLSFSVPE